jgi:hypothetical protein
VTPISLGIFASANQSAAATSFESIATVTVGSGGASSVEFTSIPGTYTHLQIRYFATKTTNGSLYLTYNGVTTGGSYTRHSIYGDGSTVAADFPGTGGNNIDVQCGNTAGNFGAGIIDILDYTNTNKKRVLRTLTGRDNNGSGLVWYTSGFFDSTNAITSIKFTPDSTNLAQYSHFALYGIKSA